VRTARYAPAFFNLIGLLIGGVLAYVAFLKLGGMGLPKWMRFAGVIAGAGMGALHVGQARRPDLERDPDDHRGCGRVWHRRSHLEGSLSR
jgi:hypothetical protein